LPLRSAEGSVRITACGKTDRGRKRPNNEDDLALVDLTAGKPYEPAEGERILVGECGLLLAVCDGVGGRKAGEIASALALESLAREVQALLCACPRNELFQQAVENVNQRVWREAELDPSLKGMGTTLTASVLCQGTAFLAHVGDSRAYFLRDGRIRQVTRDQSFLGALVESGTLTQEQAAHSPYRNVLLQAIGRKADVEVALDGVDLLTGDVLLLCTDGLWEKVEPTEMAGFLQDGDLRRACERLVDLANERGGEDNITVLVARVDDAEEET
jgi:protein phosphatase